MLNKILIALDPLEPESDLFEKSFSLVKSMNAQLMLVSVLTTEVDIAFAPPEPGLISQSYSLNDWNLFQERYQTYETNQSKILQDLVDRAKAAGIQAEFSKLSGSPGRGICTVAKTWGADLIIVGSHQRKGLRELLLGSISSYVMHHAPCSVMVVHGQALAESA